MEVSTIEMVLIEIKVIMIRKILIVIVVDSVEDVVAEDIKIVEIKEKMGNLDDVVAVILAVIKITNSLSFLSYFFLFR